ncbi:MAG: DUF91 domain-containing protein [Candidatus Heimdallarchaeota archaeon]|nr:DUF91 domain-containing protein [Candidatus Heimdallarchaeota archaeon]MCK5048011.1 DUF91 domain-containing protein [Candidatus Heimdallarchaeota archaeon]
MGISRRILVKEGKPMTDYFLHLLTSDEERDEVIIAQLKELEITHPSRIELVIESIEGWTDEQKDELLEDIRLFSRQNDVKVKSSGSGSLPISRSGSLNNSIPIVVIRKEALAGKIIFLTPLEKTGNRFDIDELLRLTAEDLDFLEAESKMVTFTEDIIIAFLKMNSEILGDGAVFKGAEIEVEGGRIDAVFQMPDETWVLVEAETEAKDNALGQVLRFVLPFSEEKNIPEDKIRKALVCLTISESLVKACKAAKVEVYVLKLEKMA